MLNALKNFIAELQHSHEERKRRWLVGLSAGTMLVVTVLWLGYVSISISTVGGGNTDNTEVVKAGQDDSVVSTLRRGTAIAYDQLSAFFKAQVETKHEIEIESPAGTVYRPKSDLPMIEPREIK